MIYFKPREATYIKKNNAAHEYGMEILVPSAEICRALSSVPKDGYFIGLKYEDTKATKPVVISRVCEFRHFLLKAFQVAKVEVEYLRTYVEPLTTGGYYIFIAIGVAEGVYLPEVNLAELQGMWLFGQVICTKLQASYDSEDIAYFLRGARTEADMGNLHYRESIHALIEQPYTKSTIWNTKPFGDLEALYFALISYVPIDVNKNWMNEVGNVWKSEFDVTKWVGLDVSEEGEQLDSSGAGGDPFGNSLEPPFGMLCEDVDEFEVEACTSKYGFTREEFEGESNVVKDDFINNEFDFDTSEVDSFLEELEDLDSEKN